MIKETEEENVRVKQYANDPRLRDTPASELDLQLMVTNPKWGDWNIPDELKETLGETRTFIDPESGNQFIDLSSLWGLLGYFTRDLRLGNLSKYGGEVEYCKEYIDFAGECLRQGLPGSFMSSLSRTISLIELSQSRGGFLRQQHNTLRNENYQHILEPKKSKLFGKKEEQK